MEKIHTNLTEDQALQLENQIYNQYLNKGYKLVNLAQPGIKGSTGHKKSPEWKRKYSKIMSKINKGRTLTPQHKANLSKSLKGRDNSSYNKKVKQYTKDGKFIKEFGSVKEAMYIMGIPYLTGGGISACALGTQKSAYGYVWKY